MFNKLKFILLFLVILSIGMVGYFTTTPYYSLIRVFYAMKNNQVESFQYYCDVDSVSESLIDEMMLIKNEDLPKDLSMTLKMMQSDTSKSHFFKKLLAKGIKTQILKGVKEYKMQENNNENVQMGSFMSLQNVLMGENHTVIKLDIQKNNENIPLHFRLRKLEGRWKLVGMEQFGDFILNSLKSQNGKR